MMLRTVAALVCLCSLLSAQEGRSQEESGGIDRKMREARARAMKENGLTEADLENRSKEELEKIAAKASNNSEPPMTSSSMCRFVASVKPAKLMPGQSGNLVITAILSGSAVIPAPAPVELIGMQQQGAVHLGALTPRPAQPGRLAAAYIGQPVYDNCAVMDVPITMSPSAELGSKQQVQVDLRFDLFDGATAQAIGKFIDRAVVPIEVGQVADPAVHGAAPARVTDAPATGAEPSAAQAQHRDPAPAPKASERSVEAQPTKVVPDPASAATVTEKPAPVVDTVPSGAESTPVLPFAIGGGLLLLVLVMLLARKK